MWRGNADVVVSVGGVKQPVPEFDHDHGSKCSTPGLLGGETRAREFLDW